jgi:alcohol dehydrogenase (cytochrome c)
MSRRLEIIILAIVALGAAAVGAGIAFLVANKTRVEVAVGETRSELLSLRAPPGTVTMEENRDYKGPAARAPAAGPSSAAGDWPSYNKTLTSERFSDLNQINTKNVGKLKVLCTYDTKQFTSFETGLIMIEGALIGTTEFDIFSIDPATCAENWRTHENYPGYILPTNRGAAYLDGMLFRGTGDGRVLAYDFKTGKRLWETPIADPKKGEAAPAAPIAWQGLVFIGNAGGDFKGGKGRMYALDAKTGGIVWEFYLVPKVEGDPVRGPLAASPLDTSTWNKCRALRSAAVQLETPELHAMAHVVVENQVALAEATPVPETFDRLIDEGLDRHEAVHAIGGILIRILFDAVDKPDDGDDINARYNRELDLLTAADWLSQLK